MSFLDSTGLAYFYQKLKDKFIATVNGQHPEDGEVTITSVASADNLNSLDSIIDNSAYIARTSAGVQNISSGDAYLAYVDGNIIYEGREEESVSLSGTNGITGTVNLSLWKTQISDDGEYQFQYTPGTLSGVNVTNDQAVGQWSYNSSPVNLASYGITLQNVNPKVLSISTNNAFATISITSQTFLSQFSVSGDYIFTAYVEESSEEEGSAVIKTTTWSYNNNPVTLSSYGIVATGDFNNNDTITVNYNSGTPSSTITILYQKGARGTIHIPKPTSFVATGFNQFNPNNASQIIQNATIINGVIVQGTGYVCFVKAIPGSVWGYIAYSEGEHLIPDGIGWCSTIPEINTELDQTLQEFDERSSRLASITFSEQGYIAVAVDNYSDLCIHTRWDNEDDEVYEEYTAPSIINFPTTGILNGETKTLPLREYGMPAIGNVRDRLDLDGSTYIQKIGRLENTSTNMNTVINLRVEYDYDDNWIYYVLPNFNYYILSFSAGQPSLYSVNDFGTEEFIGTEYPVIAENIYGENLRNKLKTDVLMISQQNPPLTNSQINSVRKNLLNIIYPVGSIYTSTNSTNPQNIWGGRWSPIQGRFLIGASSTYSAGTTGGAATVTLTTAQIPAHTHGSKTLTGYTRFRRYGTSGSGSDIAGIIGSSGIVSKTSETWSGTHGLVGAGGTNVSNPIVDSLYINATHEHTSVGSGQAHTNMPPYLAVYMWQRTA